MHNDVSLPLTHLWDSGPCFSAAGSISLARRSTSGQTASVFHIRITQETEQSEKALQAGCVDSSTLQAAPLKLSTMRPMATAAFSRTDQILSPRWKKKRSRNLGMKGLEKADKTAALKLAQMAIVSANSLSQDSYAPGLRGEYAQKAAASDAGGCNGKETC